MQRPWLAASCCSKRRALRGGWRWSARPADRRLSAQRALFRCAHSLRRADRSVGLDPKLYPALARLSVPRACIRAHASAWLPRFCRTVAIRLVIGIVLILCGLFFIAG